MSQYRLMRHLAAVATLGALATVGCFVVDDKKSDDDEGNAGNAGEESGGSGGANTGGSRTGGASSGGASTGGSPAGGGDTGGSSTGGGPPAGGSSGSSTGGSAPTGGTSGSGGSAVMKFCNGLQKGEADVTLTVDFGGVRVSTITGTCTPVVGQTCTTIPTGTDISANLYDGSTLLYEAVIGMVEAGDEVIVVAVLDEAETAPILDGGVLNADYVCSETDYVDLFPPALETKSSKYQGFSFTKDLRTDAQVPALRQTVGGKLAAYRSLR